MTANEIISNDIPVLSLNDTGKIALDIMENYQTSDLAIVDKNKLKGIITEEDICNFNFTDKKFEEFKYPLPQVFIDCRQHIFYVLKSFNYYKKNILPVLDKNSDFLGIISQKSVLESLANILCVQEDGYHLKFTLKFKDFSATELTNIAENNDAKVLSLYIDKFSDTKINVYLKIFTKDIETVLQSFDSFNYDYTVLNYQTNEYDSFYNERLDNFLNYLNI